MPTALGRWHDDPRVRLAAAWVYGVAGVVAFLVLIFVHFRVLAYGLRTTLPAVTALVGFALAMDASGWRDHVANIQLSGPIAFSYLVAWMAVRRRRDVAAGIAIGLAMTMKPY